MYKLDNNISENIEDIIDNNLKNGEELEKESLEKLKTNTVIKNNIYSEEIMKYGKALAQIEYNRQSYPDLKSELINFLDYINDLLNNYNENIGFYDTDKRAFSPSFRVFNNGSVPAKNLKLRIKHNSKVKYYYKDEIPSNGIEIYEDLKDLATSFINTINDKSNSSMVSFWNKYRKYRNKHAKTMMSDMNFFRTSIELENLKYDAINPPKWKFFIEDENFSLDYYKLLTHEMSKKFINRGNIFLIADVEKGEEVVVEYQVHADNLKESKKGTLKIKGK